MQTTNQPLCYFTVIFTEKNETDINTFPCFALDKEKKKKEKPIKP